MKALEKGAGKTLRAADCCEKRHKQIVEERFSAERSIWESIISFRIVPTRTLKILILGLGFMEFYIYNINRQGGARYGQPSRGQPLVLFRRPFQPRALVVKYTWINQSFT